MASAQAIDQLYTLRGALPKFWPDCDPAVVGAAFVYGSLIFHLGRPVLILVFAMVSILIYQYIAGFYPRYRGVVNEFMGDGILVFLGAPRQAPDDAERAVACAIEMQAAMTRVNDQPRRRNLPELSMGIGVNTGEVVVGNIGSERRSPMVRLEARSTLPIASNRTPLAVKY
jgi:hypothetical protein